MLSGGDPPVWRLPVVASSSLLPPLTISSTAWATRIRNCYASRLPLFPPASKPDCASEGKPCYSANRRPSLETVSPRSIIPAFRGWNASPRWRVGLPCVPGLLSGLKPFGNSGKLAIPIAFLILSLSQHGPMSATGLDIRPQGELDLLSLGALVHRLDPGIIPFHKANACQIHVSGGEFNVAANLADCFRMKTGIASAMVDYPDRRSDRRTRASDGREAVLQAFQARRRHRAEHGHRL